MRALRALAHGPEQLRLVEVPDVVQLDGDEVLVETRAVGVCGSDIHAWHGTRQRV
jgi:threonine dehydrogenase-like Zn-dependent dehydrogenase